MKTTETVKVYQIKVTLKHIQPPVWRSILVADNFTLRDLHDVLQVAFGWDNMHLHEFMVGKISFGDPATSDFGELEFEDEDKVKLRDLHLTKGSRFSYQYDFGDSWDHTLVVEKVLPYEKDMQLPRCIKGDRACPPEDVGGPWGYASFLEIMADPQRKEHEEIFEWYGGEFDPEAFDLERINKSLVGIGELVWLFYAPPMPVNQAAGQKSFFDPSRWAGLLAGENPKTAQALALRQDMVAFLNYLKENKVVGTKVGGNLQLKAMQGIAPRFVNPPPFQETFGNKVIHFRREEDIRPILFVHKLAQVGELVSGGPAQRWSVTSAGEEFLNLPAAGQVWVLFAAWWHRVKWDHSSYYNDYGVHMLTAEFPTMVISHLRALPVGKMVAFDHFLDELIQKMGEPWLTADPNIARRSVNFAAEGFIIDPLEQFGALSTWREASPEQEFIYPVLVSLSLTAFGHALLHLIEDGFPSF